MRPRKKLGKLKKKPRSRWLLPTLKSPRLRLRQLRANTRPKSQPSSTKKQPPKRSKNRKTMPKSKSRKLKRKQPKL